MVNEKYDRVIVTGANGYIGSQVVKKLLDNSYDVIAVDLNNNFVDKRAEFYNSDIFNLDESLYKKWGLPKAVLHLAWQDGFNHNADSHILNLTNHFNFLKRLIDFGVTSVTVMGSVHEVGYYEGKVDENTPCNPLSYYGIAKNTLRQLIQLYSSDKNVSLKWLRGYYITGNDYNNHSIFTKILESAKNGKKEFPFTKGDNQFDFINIDDLAEQIFMCTVQDETDGIINVCSGKPVAIKDKVEMFIKENNLNIKLLVGKFPSRRYDSPIIYGDNTKINTIMKKTKKENNAKS